MVSLIARTRVSVCRWHLPPRKVTNSRGRLLPRSGPQRREAGCMGDRLEPTERLLDPETMKEAGDSCLGSELADRGQTAFGQCRRCNIRCELRQGQPMPAERSAPRFGEAARQLVCGVQGCPENEHLLGGVSGFQPSASVVNPGTAGDRGDDGSCHAGRLARPDRDGRILGYLRTNGGHHLAY